ncbi:MAG: glycosyltransferase, partial [Lachnospiraceae bacterium]|nr:glycosyltransferase [Lachnospiraceae bacterium]
MAIKGHVKGIRYHFDSVTKEGANVIVRGFATCASHEQVSFLVRDEEMTEIPSENIVITRLQRPDVSQLFYNTDEYSDCGFEMYIHLEKIERLEIEMTAGPYCEREKILLVNQRAVMKVRQKIRSDRFHRAHKDYAKFMDRYYLYEEHRREQLNEEFTYTPKISVVIPVYAPDPDYFREMMDSIFAQTYTSYEICVACGTKGNIAVSQMLRKYKAENKAFNFTVLEKNEGISGNTNIALKMATGDLLIFADQDDLFVNDAFYQIVKGLNDYPDADIIYTDEDKVTADGRTLYEPHFKPDFSPDLLCTNNYIGHITAVKKKVVDQVGLLNPEMDGSQDFDFLLRCAEHSARIVHIPKVLYHWRSNAGSVASTSSAKLYALEAAKRAVTEHVERCNINADVRFTEEGNYLELVYHDRYGLLEKEEPETSKEEVKAAPAEVKIEKKEISKVSDEEKKETGNAEEAKSEEPKADAAKTEETKSDAVKAEETKAEEAKSETAKAEETKAETAKAEETKSETAKPEETKTDAVKIKEISDDSTELLKSAPAKEENKSEKPEAEKAESSKAEDTKAEDTKAEEKKADVAKAVPVRKRYPEMPFISVVFNGGATGVKPAELEAKIKKIGLKEGRYELLLGGSMGLSNTPKGDYLLFLNADLEYENGFFLVQLLGAAERPDVGAAGGLVIDRDQKIIQMGMIFADGTVFPAFGGHSARFSAYQNRNHLQQNLSILSLDCLLVRADLYRRTPGLAKNADPLFQAIDLSLSLRKLGARLVTVPLARLVQKGAEAGSERRSISLKDYPEILSEIREKGDEAQTVSDAAAVGNEGVLRKWGAVLTHTDPYFSEHLRPSESG